MTSPEALLMLLTIIAAALAGVRFATARFCPAGDVQRKQSAEPTQQVVVQEVAGDDELFRRGLGQTAGTLILVFSVLGCLALAGIDSTTSDARGASAGHSFVVGLVWLAVIVPTLIALAWWTVPRGRGRPAAERLHIAVTDLLESAAAAGWAGVWLSGTALLALLQLPVTGTSGGAPNVLLIAVLLAAGPFWRSVHPDCGPACGVGLLPLTAGLLLPVAAAALAAGGTELVRFQSAQPAFDAWLVWTQPLGMAALLLAVLADVRQFASPVRDTPAGAQRPALPTPEVWLRLLAFGYLAGVLFLGSGQITGSGPSGDDAAVVAGLSRFIGFHACGLGIAVMLLWLSQLERVRGFSNLLATSPLLLLAPAVSQMLLTATMKAGGMNDDLPAALLLNWLTAAVVLAAVFAAIVRRSGGTGSDGPAGREATTPE